MPKTHLTDQLIRGINTPNKRVEYFDKPLIQNNQIKKKGVKGLAIRITPTGKKSFVYRYWYNGASKRYTIGTYPTISLKDARNKAVKLHQLVQKGIDPLYQKSISQNSKHVTWQQIVNSYKKYHLPKLKQSTQTDYERRIKHLVKGEGEKETKSRGFPKTRLVKDIKRYEVIKFVDEIALKSPTNAKRLQSLLSGIFHFALDREIIDSNPATRIKVRFNKTSPKWKNVVFDEEQIKILWRAFDLHNEPVGSFLKFLLITGQRAGETRLMKWDDIDFECKLWIIPSQNTKNSLRHRVPLSDLALNTLNNVQNHSNYKYVFESPFSIENPINHPQKAAQRIRINTNVNEFNIHSLRTTAATYLAELGTSPQVLSKILNHKKPGQGNMITAIYNRYEYLDESREALNKWAEKLLSIT